MKGGLERRKRRQQRPQMLTTKNSSPRSITFINANARSLMPKLDSLGDCFHEKKLDFATLTETWFSESDRLDGVVADLKDQYGLGILVRNRAAIATNGRKYGGVALVYRLRTSNFKEFTLHNPDNHEVLACVGKIHGIKGKVFVISCYAPPNLTSLNASKMIEFVSDVVGEAKRRFEDCTLVISGDFNQWSIAELIADHVELREIAYGPTRGSKEIDRTLVNFSRSISESGTLPPLETEDGRASDHKIAWARAEFAPQDRKLITYSYRAYTEAGADAFVESISGQDWITVFDADSTDDKVAAFQSILELNMAKHFEWKTTVRRETDPPWINDKIRGFWKKSRKIYDREGRSKYWKTLGRKTDRLIRKRARKYIENQKLTLTAPDAARAFHKNVKAYKSKEKPVEFDVRQLYEGCEDSEVAEKLAEHFNAISQEFDGLNPDEIPVSQSLTLPPLHPGLVQKRLTDFRKPKSTVKGDIFPALVSRVAPFIASPLADIYNTITRTARWPSEWKIEYVTPIPKKSIPESADDLRNISCTQLFSKIYESFILEWLGKQITLRTNQYGGVKGCGTEHYLVQLWQQVLQNIEDPRASSLLVSIDYAKAFNRLDFGHCLKALKAKGACSEIIAIVASFLTDRTMRVKIGASFSKPRQVMGGVPQGSLLGVLLFNLSVDDFESYSTDVAQYNSTDNYVPVPQAPNPPTPLAVPSEPTNRDYRHLPPWASELLQVLKYVDDIIINEKVNFDRVGENAEGFREKLAVRAQNLFRQIVHQAESQGMRVNSAKTKALLISELKNYIPTAYFTDSEGNKITAGNTMKILGFNFSSDPDMTAQVAAIKAKFRSRTWILRHLGHRGFSKEDLVKVYRSIILPVHDYCSCVYNSSLTLTQASALERLQAQALKSIYGYEHSYQSLLQVTGLKRLQDRRDDRCDAFAKKALLNDRFRAWFPLNYIARPTRNPLTYTEDYARTKRLFNSPLYHMRRRLNGKPY